MTKYSSSVSIQRTFFRLLTRPAWLQAIYHRGSGKALLWPHHNDVIKLMTSYHYEGAWKSPWQQEWDVPDDTNAASCLTTAEKLQRFMQFLFLKESGLSSRRHIALKAFLSAQCKPNTWQIRVRGTFHPLRRFVCSVRECFCLMILHHYCMHVLCRRFLSNSEGIGKYMYGKKTRKPTRNPHVPLGDRCQTEMEENRM